MIADSMDLLLGRRDELTPPKRKIFVGPGDFKKIGEEFLAYFVELGGLKPYENVLDVGCGIGRMAVPLTRYLNDQASYQGFDTVAYGIKWCKKRIAPRYPNFHFRLADIYNKAYKPSGQYKASEYRFPYEDESFDFIFLTSVFTHMLPRDMENYLAEIARTLKVSGRCLITFFLLNGESLQLIDAKLSSPDFEHEFEGCRIMAENNPEAAIAYDENFIRGLYGKYDLNILDPIRYGSWCGRKNFLSYQDIITAAKE